MIPPGRDDELDVSAVARDDELLDRLARRADLSGDADVVTRMLAAYAASIDDELPDLLASPQLDLAASVSGGSHARPPEPQTRRFRSARAGAVALVVGATLSVGGVSAAVTGDPLSAYHSVARALGVEQELPPQAADVAQINRKVLHLKRAMRAGTATPAQLAALRAEVASADIPGGRRDALLRLLDRLAGEAPGDKPAVTPPGQQRSHGPDEGKAGKPDHPDNSGSGRSGAQPTPEPERTQLPGRDAGATTQPRRPEPGTKATPGRKQGGARRTAEPATPQPTQPSAVPSADAPEAGPPEPPGNSDQEKGNPRR